MNIPILIEVAVSLILLYLVFSLLASEVQEFIATVLQWRAKHLRESIEVFLAGGNEASPESDPNNIAEVERAKELANRIYNHPLISTLNYQAIGLLRQVRVPRQRGKRRGIGERETAPSYINSDLFATTLLKTLRLPEILQQLNGAPPQNSEVIQKIAQRIRYFYSKTIDEISTEIEYSNLSHQTKLNFKRANFIRPIEFIDAENIDRKTFTLGVKKTLSKVEEYIKLAEKELPQNFQTKTKIINQIKLLKQAIYHDIDNALSLNSYYVSVQDIISYYRQLRTGIADWQHPDNPVHQRIKTIIQDETFLEYLPNGLLDSLDTIYNRTQTTIDHIETDINQFHQDLAIWFDRGMERASGVYTRNAKVVGFLIGLSLAFGTNFDTFYVSSELWQDSNLRSLLGEEAVQFVEDDPNLQALLTNEFETANLDTSFPLGWDVNNLESQQEKREKWEVREIELGWGVQFMGWVISGIAIAMGAPFWFDILNRFVRFRNTGGKP
jgi:hypothetical protein